MVQVYLPQNFKSNSNRFLPQGIGGIVGPLLLDKFPNSAAAYSLRQLRTEYLGPAIRVIRTSDFSSQDIGFLANGNLDIPSLVAFVGASDGIVKIIFEE